MGRRTKLEVVGRGTWLDMVASRVLEREQSLGRKVDVLRTESGMGASGIPTVGSLGDVVRAYGIKLALETQGRRAEFIAFSDDMDGLRKVPAGMPESLQKYLGHPVSAIPDPYNCHESYSKHMNSLLIEAMDICGVEYVFHSGADDYKKGLFIEQTRKILAASDRVGKIVKEEIGQEKYTEVLPYFPICGSCGRIYTTRALGFEVQTDKVGYSCEGGTEIKGQTLRGCGYKGEADIKDGRGKIPWKAEFAARWDALKINFEAYGKDLLESVRVNDRVCEEILGYPAPFHVRYEFFLDKGGKKVSKSRSVDVMTPQVWFKYAPPASLNLLMFKRITGARNIGVEDIPTYVNELNQLDEVYFGLKSVSDEKELAKLKGLYEYTYFLKPPPHSSKHVPYNLLVYLVTVAPPDKRKEYVEAKLAEYGYVKGGMMNSDIEEEMAYAVAWAKDFQVIPETNISYTNPQKLAIEDLITVVRTETDERKLQNQIFSIAKKYDLEPPEFFKLLYTILLGSPRGPRLGPYIKAMGSENVASALERAIGTPQLS